MAGAAQGVESGVSELCVVPGGCLKYRGNRIVKYTINHGAVHLKPTHKKIANVNCN